MIQTAEFIRSCTAAEQFPRERIPEIAFVGRSNVGKSSAINALANRHGLAKVGKVPGKTQTINFFKVAINDPVVPFFYLVDLPGYGYAKVPKSVKERWRTMIEEYFSTRELLKGVVVLLDLRANQSLDARLLQWLATWSLPIVLVATKADKIGRSQRPALLRRARETVDIGASAFLWFSARTHEGKRELLKTIKNVLIRPA
ncbi:MAG: YihA family ribosome biogenesis GTP-binding protein [Nitrospirae bacterium]|nr:MAG: YihA family ribosome biogenesis GTP-binding protein [Nitrospirota bacterium]